jgi:hypothetical protein
MAQTDQIVEDKDVRVVRSENLTYPHSVQTSNLQGVVVVRLRLDGRGKVVDAAAISGNPILARISVENGKKWQFEPNAQKSAILVYDFRIEGICSSVTGSQMIFHPPNFVSIIGCGITVQPHE